MAADRKTVSSSCLIAKQKDGPARKKSGQSIVMSTYQMKIAGRCRLITVTWCKNALVHGLSVSVEGNSSDHDEYTCKVDLKPWQFWRKQGRRSFQVDGKPVDMYWDLRLAKFATDPEPVGDYYVAIVYEEEVVLHLGNMKKEAYRCTGSRPSLIDATLVSRKEHVFGRKKFITKGMFDNRGVVHDLSIEYTEMNQLILPVKEPEMLVCVDGHVVMKVTHLQWNFRGNVSICVDKTTVEVFWDVHDWLFTPGLRHALFIFKPSSEPSSASPPSSTISHSSLASDFCLYIYAWKLE